MVGLQLCENWWFLSTVTELTKLDCFQPIGTGASSNSVSRLTNPARLQIFNRRWRHGVNARRSEAHVAHK